MPCHIARYQERNSERFGWALVSDGFYRIDCECHDTKSFLEDGRDLAVSMAKRLGDYQDQKLEASEITLVSPITTPCRLLCQGSNYPSSRIETGMNPKDKRFNTIFHKSDASIAGPYDDIVKPKQVQLLDYEIEMAVVIGKTIDQPVSVNQNNLHEYIAGIVMTHDVTARDIQIPQGQFFKGKSYRTFCPTGPYLCLLDAQETHYLQQLQLRLTVNNEIRQLDNSCHLIFKPEETLAELSNITNLDVGDLILTGSPGGSALSVPPALIVKLLGLLPEQLKWNAFVKGQMRNPKYLKHGDVVEANIVSTDGKVNLGTQINKIKSDIQQPEIERV